MDNRIVVIGAGITGLLLARELVARGETVTVVEKSRGLGGRLATKRIGSAVFDQGAQYFTAKDPRFEALVEQWRGRGLVAQWPGASPHRHIAQPSMNALGKALADGLDVRREWKVQSVRRVDAEWVVSTENQPELRASRLVLTAPVPQALALLQAGEVALPGALAADLATLTYLPCLALLVTLDGPSGVPAEGVAIASGPVRWIADNTKKGISSGPNAALTVHLAAAFAAEHYGKTETELAALVLPVITPWLGAGVAGVALHRWKFSEPATTFAEPCVWIDGIGLGLAGDAFGGPRVEGAALSGLALADKMAAK